MSLLLIAVFEQTGCSTFTPSRTAAPEFDDGIAGAFSAPGNSAIIPVEYI